MASRLVQALSAPLGDVVGDDAVIAILAGERAIQERVAVASAVIVQRWRPGFSVMTSAFGPAWRQGAVLPRSPKSRREWAHFRAERHSDYNPLVLLESVFQA